jgi:hypothetical protein
MPRPGSPSSPGSGPGTFLLGGCSGGGLVRVADESAVDEDRFPALPVRLAGPRLLEATSKPDSAKANGVDLLSEDGTEANIDDPAAVEALEYTVSLIEA